MTGVTTLLRATLAPAGKHPSGACATTTHLMKVGRSETDRVLATSAPSQGLLPNQLKEQTSNASARLGSWRTNNVVCVTETLGEVRAVNTAVRESTSTRSMNHLSLRWSLPTLKMTANSISTCSPLQTRALLRQKRTRCRGLHPNSNQSLLLAQHNLRSRCRAQHQPSQHVSRSPAGAGGLSYSLAS